MNRLAIALVALFVATTAPAQDVPFTGVLVEDSVQARAGAGRAYYVVGELKRGDLVQVEEVIFGWNRVAAPQGTYSYISKAFVDVQGDGRTGTVNAERTDVKAGSVKGPGESYRAQVVLNKGDTVKVLEEAGSYYKIQPPKGASVFIPPGSVRRADAVESARAQPKPEDKPEVKPEDKPEVKPEVQPTPIPVVGAGETGPGVTEMPEIDTVEAAETTTAEASPDAPDAPDNPETVETVEATESVVEGMPSDAMAEGGEASQSEVLTPPAPESPESVAIDVDSDKLQVVENKMAPLFAMQLEDQDLDAMATAYQQMAADPSLTATDQLVIRRRLAAIERNRVIKDAVMATASARQESIQREEERAKPTGPISYDAVGRLMASNVYNGINLPRMFRVVNPNGSSTIAYVRPGQVDAGVMMGKIVGVVGVASYDPSTKLNIIDVQRIDVLDTPEAPEDVE